MNSGRAVRREGCSNIEPAAVYFNALIKHTRGKTGTSRLHRKGAQFQTSSRANGYIEWMAANAPKAEQEMTFKQEGFLKRLLLEKSTKKNAVITAKGFARNLCTHTEASNIRVGIKQRARSRRWTESSASHLKSSFLSRERV